MRETNAKLFGKVVKDVAWAGVMSIVGGLCVTSGRDKGRDVKENLGTIYTRIKNKRR
jgi:hypothetical protein